MDFAWKGPCVKISTTSPTGRQAPSSRSALHISCGDSGRVSRIPLSRLKMIILSPPLPATLLLLPRTQLHHYPHPNPTIPTAAALVVNLPKHRITSSIPSKSDMVSALSLVKISLSCGRATIRVRQLLARFGRFGDGVDEWEGDRCEVEVCP